MMYSLGSPIPLSPSAWIFHCLGATLWVSGVILLIAWALRSCTPERLRTLGLWSLVLGVLATVLALASGWNAPYADPNDTATTAPRFDTVPKNPDHLMPDGTMMRSDAM